MAAMENRELHVVFLPYFITSHMIPLVNVARLFASRGVKATIITTPSNAALFRSVIDYEILLGHQISICTLQFPAAEVGLPEGIENISSMTSMEMLVKIDRGVLLLRKPMENLIIDIRPNCIFSDMFYPWTNDLAEKLNIPRLLFYPNNLVSHCLPHNLELYAPHQKVNSDFETFLVPGLPHEIEMKGSQIEQHVKTKTRFGEVIKIIKESEDQSYAMVHDTIYELEPEYVDYYQKLKGKKHWTIGPLFHFSNTEETNPAASHICFNWLDNQESNTVLFICFGSLAQFSDAQLKEIALALEATNQPFIWVVRNKEKTQENEQESWLPYGFEERLNKSNRGLIIRSWAPQLMILRHPAVGGFMTHCGWNSLLESITSGVPPITWPLFAEQFYNEKLIGIQQLGVSVGADVYNIGPVINCAVVGSKKIEEAIRRLMSNSEESKKIRQKAEECAAMAKKAVQEGGSSYQNLTALIEELKYCAFGLNE